MKNTLNVNLHGEGFDPIHYAFHTASEVHISLVDYRKIMSEKMEECKKAREEMRRNFNAFINIPEPVFETKYYASKNKVDTLSDEIFHLWEDILVLEETYETFLKGEKKI